jgi:hypothetical protein
MVIKPTTGNHGETVKLCNTRLRKKRSKDITNNSANSVRREDLPEDEYGVKMNGK